jgi:hypothetical protein
MLRLQEERPISGKSSSDAAFSGVQIVKFQDTGCSDCDLLSAAHGCFIKSSVPVCAFHLKNVKTRWENTERIGKAAAFLGALLC